MVFATQTPAELCALTDSLASSIRWRMQDYQALLRAELEILAGPDIATRARLVRAVRRPALRV